MGETCGRCGAALPDEGQPCPACSGDAPAALEAADLSPLEEAGPAAPAAPLELELQRAQGDAIEGPYDRITLQEMLYAGRLTGEERVRAPGAPAFVMLREHAELAFVLDRFHGEAVRARAAAPPPADAAASAAPTESRRPEVAVQEVMEQAGLQPGRLALIVVGTLLVGVAVVVALFVSQVG